MPCPLALVLAALLPTAFVNEIPDGVRDEAPISIAQARTRLIATQGKRIFFKTRGTILADKRGKGTTFILLDKTAATTAICSCDDPWQVGDEVAVICTAMQPEYENPTLISEALEIRVLQHREPTMPSFVHPADLAGHRNDFNLVKVDGVVTDAFLDGINPLWTILVLSKDNAQTMIWTHTEDLGNCRPDELINSVMHVTGIVLPDLSEFYRSRRPWVLAPSQDALHIVSRPSWWTPPRLLLLVVFLVLLLLAILTWNAALRIRSERTSLRLDERTRLAVELHDTIAQNLTGASFEIKTITRLADTNLAKMKEHLDIVDRTLKSCRDDIRNCIWDLRTNSLDQKEIDEAIRQALDPHIGDASLTVRFNVPRPKISEPTLHALIRILRELAINAVRHGHASEIRVAGSIEGRQLLFSLRDNGTGFDPKNIPSTAQGHFGLQGVRERIRRLNGQLTIDSSPGSGARIAVCLDLFSCPKGGLP